MTSPFLPTASWIWDDSDPDAVVYYNLRARRDFLIGEGLLEEIRQLGGARLCVTAESYYQVWINDEMIGHGPAKSPEGERFVDTYDLSCLRVLRTGENRLEILVHALGVGTMNACPGRAGLLFQLDLPGEVRVQSDGATQVRKDPQRAVATVRRWMLPCLEDVDAAAEAGPWQAARVVGNSARLLPRPVGLPSRATYEPERMLAFEQVRLPTFSHTFRIKPYLVSEQEQRRCNLYLRKAVVVADLMSEEEQEVEFVPTSGHIAWFFDGRLIAWGSGWERWPETPSPRTIRLRRGANRLIGLHGERSHFQDVSLAAFAAHPITVRNPRGVGGFQVILADQLVLPTGKYTAIPSGVLELIEQGPFPVMDPAHTLPSANAQDRMVNAKVVNQLAPRSILNDQPRTFMLPPPKAGKDHANRLILDLGAVRNGWLAFSVHGRKGSVLTFSLFEALEPGTPLRSVWTGACNNGFRYALRDGWQRFQTLFAYGARYVAIYHEGTAPVELRDLRLHSAHCGNLSSAAILTGDLELDSIYALCEQTLRAASDDTLTDCPTYEAVNWNFDNRLGAMGDLLTFRNLPLLRNTIEQYTRDPWYPGLVRSHTPSTWQNRIPVFSFHWIILCREYHWHTDDREFLRRVFPQVTRGLAEALRMIDPLTGLLRWRDVHDSWHIIDWANGRDDEHEIVSAEQALLLGALEAGEYMAGVLQDADWQATGESWRKARAQVSAAIDRHLWISERDAYADSLHADGRPSPVSSQVSNAALALHGVGNADWRKRLHQRLGTGDPTLLAYGSPMGLFYILEFLDQQEDVETLFRLIRKKWGPMLAAGDKTAWEHFADFSGRSDNPTRSRCHPFATYVLKYYAKYLLGVEFLAPGQRKISFAPKPPADLRRCRGSLPSAEGWIRVSWERGADGRLAAAIETPPAVSVVAQSLVEKPL